MDIPKSTAQERCSQNWGGLGGQCRSYLHTYLLPNAKLKVYIGEEEVSRKRVTRLLLYSMDLCDMEGTVKGVGEELLFSTAISTAQSGAGELG